MRRLATLHLNTERTWRGGEQQTLYLAEGIARRGHLARVLCQPSSEMGRRARDAGLDVVEIAMRSELDPVAVWRIGRHIRRAGYDIVHMHTSHAHTLGVLATLRGPRPRRVVHRRVDFTIFRNALKLSRFKYRHGVDRYIAISGAVKDVMVEDGIPARRISVVPSGIDPARLDRCEASRAATRASLGLGLETPVVGCVAHLAWHKGQEFLVRAVPRLVAAIPGARVVIVGEGEHRPVVEAEIERLGVGGHVFMTGFRPDVPALLRAFDVLAVPSVKEGLNTTLLDAQCVGLPVVASRVGGIPEAVPEGEGGVLVPPRDPAALAAALAGLLRDAGRRAELGRRGQDRVRRTFRVERMVEGILDVYRELLEEPPP